jgi:integrase
MASVFKRGRWVDAQGRKCTKDTPGAKWVESRFWTVQYFLNGKPKTIKGYTDKTASEQLGAKMERAKARGEVDMVDLYKPHRGRPLAEHVADWISELRQLGRDDVYIGLCDARMARLMKECGWSTLGDISADGFTRWRETATATVGHAKKAGTNVVTMGARTRNHYLETLRCFCRWVIKRKRMPTNPVADVAPVETVGQLRRERRALTEDELIALLGAVKPRHSLAYRIILATGLRRDELRQLRWGDVKLNAPMPFIQLRAETTKAKRADVLPVRGDLAKLLTESRGDAGDDDRICRSIPSMETHRRYLDKAGIAYLDDRGRRADFHSLRHSYGSLLAKSGVAPRVAMALMRHTDMRLTMNVYTDPRIFDLAGAVEKLPTLPADAPQTQTVKATGTDGATAARSGAAKASVVNRLE